MLNGLQALVNLKILVLKFSDIFEDFFGDFGGGGRSRNRRSNNRGSDLRYDLSISLEEAYSGKKQDIKFSTTEQCGTCKGNGSKPGYQTKLQN